MKFIPILFSTEMVKAILDGRKTMTRRVLKNKFLVAGNPKFSTRNSDRTGTCPYGQPGDVLWVRESWAQLKNGHDEVFYDYKTNYGPEPVDWNWKPSIHMPKAACRLFLQIESIRVERLQDISEWDAECEGVEDDELLPIRFKQYGNHVGSCESAVTSFQTLWKSINGEESWQANPWVWVITFKKIDKPNNF